MKTLKSLLAIVCVVALSFAFCGDVFADGVTVGKSRKEARKNRTYDDKKLHVNENSVYMGKKNKDEPTVTRVTSSNNTYEKNTAGLSEASPYSVNRVVSVESGDALVLTLQNGGTYNCTIWGVEIPRTWENWQKGKAKKALEEMISKGNITVLVCNGKAKTRARLKRNSGTLLVKIKVAPGVPDVGKEMIKQGYAVCYQAEVGTTGMGVDDYARVQAQAQKQFLNCWGSKPDEESETGEQYDEETSDAE